MSNTHTLHRLPTQCLLPHLEGLIHSATTQTFPKHKRNQTVQLVTWHWHVLCGGCILFSLVWVRTTFTQRYIIVVSYYTIGVSGGWEHHALKRSLYQWKDERSAVAEGFSICRVSIPQPGCSLLEKGDVQEWKAPSVIFKVCMIIIVIEVVRCNIFMCNSTI